MKLGDKHIGKGRTYVIAEAGVNHNGSFERAKELVRKAAEAGADAIKFQTYTADELVVKGTPKFWDWDGDKKYESQYDAYKALEGFKREWYKDLIGYCKLHNIEFLSTPFSIESADFLNSLGVSAFKIASSDMSTLPFLKHIARFQKPIILSTGASDLSEVKEAVKTIEDEGNENIVILHCTLSYPTKDEDANLEIIRTLKKQFPFYPIGLSDHTLGVFPSLVAIAMGASVLEKHYTIDKTLGESADHWLSVDPQELKEIVDGARRIEKLKGSGIKAVHDAERETRKYDKRSLVTKIPIREGQVITEEMVTYKRPGTGIWPKHLKRVVGRKVRMALPADTILVWEHFHQK